MIEGGYVILSRESFKMLEGMTPCSRELYTYLLQRVNHTDGQTHKRGQGFFRLYEIRKDLRWNVGYRENQYSEDQMRTALKTLVKTGMVQASKTTRGIHITILFYNDLQNPKSYEARSETRVVYDPETKSNPEPDPLLYHKEQKELRNNEERKNIPTPVIQDEDYNLHITTNSYSAKKGKYVEVESDGRREVQSQVSEIIEVSKSWMPSQPESLRYLVASAIKSQGYDKCKATTEFYAKGIAQGKYDNPITNAKYWWSDGIYAHMNKAIVKTPEIIKEEKKLAPIKKKCNTCHVTQEFPKDNVPQLCPLCDEGLLLSRIEYISEFPPEPVAKPKPVENLTQEEEYHKNNVQAFLSKFASKR